MTNIRIILQHSRKQRRIPPNLDSFILGLPEYSSPESKPRPRPLSFGDFQLLVDADSLEKLEAVGQGGCRSRRYLAHAGVPGRQDQRDAKAPIGLCRARRRCSARPLARHHQSQRHRLRHALPSAGLRATASASGAHEGETASPIRRRRSPRSMLADKRDWKPRGTEKCPFFRARSRTRTW